MLGEHATTVTIRLASLNDAAEVASTQVAAWRESYADLVPPAMLSSMSVEGRTAVWKKVINGPSSESTNVHVAEIDRKVIAFGSCGAQRSRELKDKGYDGEISALYVLKDFQRHLIGTKLLQAMASDLRDRG